jgi:hypothetical protein
MKQNLNNHNISIWGLVSVVPQCHSVKVPQCHSASYILIRIYQNLYQNLALFTFECFVVSPTILNLNQIKLNNYILNMFISINLLNKMEHESTLLLELCCHCNYRQFENVNFEITTDLRYSRGLIPHTRRSDPYPITIFEHKTVALAK